MGHPDPIRIKAYVDDLARLGVRHGLGLRQFDGHTMIEPAPSDFRDYCAPMGDEEACLTIEVLGPPTSVAELSGSRSPGRGRPSCRASTRAG